MLIHTQAAVDRVLPCPREYAWQIMSADDASDDSGAGCRLVAGPSAHIVGRSHVLELPATPPDGLPGLYMTTITHISEGYLVSSRIVGPLLEQRETWTLRDQPDGCHLHIEAWVQASATIYQQEPLQTRTHAMLTNAADALIRRCQAAA